MPIFRLEDDKLIIAQETNVAKSVKSASIRDSDETHHQHKPMQQTLLYTPPTQGIKYIGSKLKFIPHVLELVKKVNPKTILDGFSGTTRVSQAFAKLGYTVISNDTAPWSEVFGTAICSIQNRKKRINPSLTISMLCHLWTAGSRKTTAGTPTVDAQSKQRTQKTVAASQHP